MASGQTEAIISGSYQIGDGNSGDRLRGSESLVTFMVFDSAIGSPDIQSAIIRGILTSRGVPFFFFEHVKGKPASICVPASRLEDARRAVAEAWKIGGQIEEMGLFEK
jgi:hypothetical protein